MKKTTLGLALALISTNLAALPVTIDADSYALGNTVSSPNSDVSIHAIYRSTDGTISNRDLTIAQAPTSLEDLGTVTGFGDNVFGVQRDNGTTSGSLFGVSLYDYFYGSSYTGSGSFAAMAISFFDPVQYLSVKTLSFSDPTVLRAYDSNGNFLSQVWATPNRSSACHCEVSSIDLLRGQADIAYVIVGGSQSAGYVNEFTYDVPAPSSMALMLLGLAGGVVARKRAKLASA